MREYLVCRSAPTVEPVTLAEAKLQLHQTLPHDDTLILALVTAARQAAESITRRALVAQKWSYLMDTFPRPGLNVGTANWYGPQWGINPGPLTVLSPDGFTGYEIFLPLPPTLSVDSITYIDSQSGLATILDPSQYLIVIADGQTCITPSYGNVWPQAQDQKAAVSVNFTAGYAAPMTADPASDTIIAPYCTALQVGNPVRLSNGGGQLPDPLLLTCDYYVQAVIAPGTYKLAAWDGGAAIDLTSAGSGQSFVGVIPEGIKAWIKVRLGTLYENREEVAILNRGKMEVLPYVDGLLDPFRVLRY